MRQIDVNSIPILIEEARTQRRSIDILRINSGIDAVTFEESYYDFIDDFTSTILQFEELYDPCRVWNDMPCCSCDSCNRLEDEEFEELLRFIRELRRLKRNGTDWELRVVNDRLIELLF